MSLATESERQAISAASEKTQESVIVSIQEVQKAEASLIAANAALNGLSYSATRDEVLAAMDAVANAEAAKIAAENVNVKAIEEASQATQKAAGLAEEESMAATLVYQNAQEALSSIQLTGSSAEIEEAKNQLELARVSMVEANNLESKAMDEANEATKAALLIATQSAQLAELIVENAQLALDELDASASLQTCIISESINSC